MKRKRVVVIGGRLTEVLLDEGPRSCYSHAGWPVAGKRHAGSTPINGTTDLTPRPAATEADSCPADRGRVSQRMLEERRAFRSAVLAEVGGPREIGDLMRALQSNGWMDISLGPHA